MLYAGQCKNQVKNCPGMCMASYQPVCARNALGVKKTFANACTLSVANCLESIGLSRFYHRFYYCLNFWEYSKVKNSVLT